jgi:hypothetical protein
MAGHTANTQGNPNEGACGYRSAEKANIIRMGLSDIYNPKEGYDSTYYQQFSGAKWIVRRPYPIPKISTTLQELEGFTYATALDLNMGQYTIRLDPRAVEMFTIIFHGANTRIRGYLWDMLVLWTFSKQK